MGIKVGRRLRSSNYVGDLGGGRDSPLGIVSFTKGCDAKLTPSQGAWGVLYLIISQNLLAL